MTLPSECSSWSFKFAPSRALLDTWSWRSWILLYVVVSSSSSSSRRRRRKRRRRRWSCEGEKIGVD